MKRLLLLCFALSALALAGMLVFQLLWEPGSEQTPAPAPDQAAQVAQGAYLARAGNCMVCHTAQGGLPYAGGNALATPFGVMYGPNLTPDVETGLGKWNANDFWRAMHNGKSRDGRFLYPAFPYPNYTKVSRADSDALFAFLGTLAPVRQHNRVHALRFPFNQRMLLAFWRTWYFSPGQYQPQVAMGAQWNRGAYLVQGLGHCSACHAPRNALGASLNEVQLGGGSVGEQGWHAPALGGTRDQLELAALLRTGVSERDAVAGPMADVVSASLQHLSSGDIGAISSYLVTVLASDAQSTAMTSELLAEAAPVLKLGQHIYRKQCASCHGEGGEGVPRIYPRLAGGRASASSNAIRMVLNGGFAPATAANPRPYSMPPFNAALSDAEAAAVLSYVRNSWGNEMGLVPEYEVARYRSGE